MKLRSLVNNTTAALGFTALFGLAAAPAQALELGCYTPAQIPALKEQMKKEVQVPVLKFYQNGAGRGANTPKWLESIITMNPETRTGHRLDKNDDGGLCITSNMTDIQLFDHASREPDSSAYMQTPGANAKAGGINRILFSLAAREKLLPMLKANEHVPDLKLNAVAYVLGNKSNGEGGILMASYNGTLMDKYTKAIPYKSEDVPHGAIFTEVGKEIIAHQSASPQDMIARAP